MKRILFIISVLFSSLSMFGQGYYTHYCADKDLVNKANMWKESGVWRNGFIAASPHSSVNAVDFYVQYHKNQKQMDALFKWLANTDLLTISKGKHPIEGTDLVASVEDTNNQSLEKRKSESHYHNIDFQYVVKGIERFGIIDHYTSVPNCAYRPDVIHYDYDVSKARFYDSSPDKFFLFFPGDWHIAKINSPKSENQIIRVIVVKIPYK